MTIPDNIAQALTTETGQLIIKWLDKELTYPVCFKCETYNYDRLWLKYNLWYAVLETSGIFEEGRKQVVVIITHSLQAILTEAGISPEDVKAKLGIENLNELYVSVPHPDITKTKLNIINITDTSDIIINKIKKLLG